jgi:hypothetical protein
MNESAPKMHVCKNCGFMSTDGKLFVFVDGYLQCIVCVEQYSEFLFSLKPTKTV